MVDRVVVDPLLSLMEDLSRSLTPREVADAVVTHGTRAFGATPAIFWVVEPDGSLRMLRSAGIPESVARAFNRLPMESDLPINRAVREGQPIWTTIHAPPPEPSAELERAVRAVHLTYPVIIASLPLVMDARAIGGLSLLFCRPGTLSPEERDRLLALARHCTQALERARLFEAERRARGRLEVLVERSQRTEEELRHAYELAKEADRRKDEFLAMLGHELRNPLSPIVTALEVMRMRDGGANGRERAVIERQVRHLVRLVDDLLDVSRITRGKIELRRRRVDLLEVTAKAVEIASPLFEERRHSLLLDTPTRGLIVDADETRLSQVIANLLTNAARYTPPGGHVVVHVEREGDNAVVRVQDDGVGIPTDMLPSIFDLFVQGKRGPDRAEGGLGLGLALVKSLVEMHGGTVAARSDGVGRGSEFIVRIPAAQPSTRDVPSRPPGPSLCASAARRVLVVDDNKDAAELLGELLSAYGHAVTLAFDGPSALVAADTFEPDAVVLDIGLPVMDGYELAAKLRERWGQSVELIAVTGYGQENDKTRAAMAGFDRHLVKPVDGDELIAALTK